VPLLEGGIGDRKLILIGCLLQFDKGTKPHLCIVERNSPTPVCRRFNLTQEGLGRVIPGGVGPGDGINVWRREGFFCHSIFHI